MDETLFAFIEAQARAIPEATALVALDGDRLSYAQLADRVRGMAALLSQLGIARTDKVALVLPNGPDAALAFLGTAAAAVAAPLNPGYGPDEFAFYLEDLDAKLVVADFDAVPAIGATCRHLGVRMLSSSELTAATASATGPFEVPHPGDVALVLHTSGTTSRPKIVPLSHANLVCSARHVIASLQLGAIDRCLNVMPLFHIHGLVGAVLASLAAGGSVVCTPGFDASSFIGWLGRFSPTWFTAVPTMHQAIVARLQAGDPLPPAASLRFIRSCSSALPPKLMADLETHFRVPVVEAYGMTEAAHQMACNPLPPRARKPGSVGVASGVEIAVMDTAGNLLGPEAVGEIVVCGPNVTSGYASPAGANATAFSHGWFHTGDQGRIDRDGYVFLTGRIKEIINRGGEKVSPREIDEALLEHPAVAQAVAFAVPHVTLGEDISAAVVLRPGVKVTADQIRDHVFARLAEFKVPSSVVIVDSIPKGPTGKVQRIGLHEKLRDHLAPVFEAPRDDIEGLIGDIWCEIVGAERVSIQDNFFLLGGDSIRAARVVARVNDLFASGLRVTELFRHPTLARFTEVARAAADPERLQSIVLAFDESEPLPPGSSLAPSIS